MARWEERDRSSKEVLSTIEEAVSQAKAMHERVTVEAQDGAEERPAKAADARTDAAVGVCVLQSPKL